MTAMRATRTTAADRLDLEIRAPATGAPLGAVHITPPEQVASVVRAAALVQGLWSQLRLVDRARYMRRAAQAVIDEFSELESLLGDELGRARPEVAVAELLAAVDALRWVADEGPRILASERVAPHRSLQPLKRALVHHEPLGVIGVIGSAGAPFALPLGQIAQALFAGNAVVFKPSPRAALSAERVARVLARAGLPEGLVRLTHGGADTGRALAGAPVARVVFTGRREAGLEVARVCAETGRGAVLESGGSDAMLVLADAPVARAAAGASWAAFSAAGQARGSLERIYVVREAAERFTRALVARSQDLRVGDPSDPSVQIGPLASERRRARLVELVDEAVAGGATLHCGGPVELSGAPGAYYAPGVLTGVSTDMRIAREPIGGPVVTVTTVDSPEEALARVNASEHGLGASVWTADRYQAQRIARVLDVGMVWLNDHLTSPTVPQGPWGGVRSSGTGRTLGRAGLMACVSPRLVTWDPPHGRAPWWFPYDDALQRATLSVARMRSARDPDRSRGLREGGLVVARLLGRTTGRRG